MKKTLKKTERLGSRTYEWLLTEKPDPRHKRRGDDGCKRLQDAVAQQTEPGPCFAMKRVYATR